MTWVFSKPPFGTLVDLGASNQGVSTPRPAPLDQIDPWIRQVAEERLCSVKLGLDPHGEVYVHSTFLM